MTRLTTELYSHSHLITRNEAAALGLPVEHPSLQLEGRLLAYYEQLKADLVFLRCLRDADDTRGHEPLLGDHRVKSARRQAQSG